MCGLIAGWGQGCPDEERVEKMGSLAELEILGCRFTRAAEAEVVKQICSWFDAPVRVSNTIVTVNVAILMMLRRDRRLAEAVGGADLVVADGVPLIWASRWLGTPLPGRVAGVDLMTRLLQLGSARRLRVFLLGTTQERLDKLVEVVGERYPGIDVVGARNGYFSIEEHRSVAEQVRDAGADLLLVGMPAPAKELWCEQFRDVLQTPVILGVGGGFDVLAGYVRRAPLWAQNMGLEWAWRLLMEPRKLWKRYLVTNTEFLGVLAVSFVRRILLRSASPEMSSR
jgi:N-acetylglucosaminyldiphosphoundecaprenol N-acetyl-beta-D-mannosaminyltransferase